MSPSALFLDRTCAGEQLAQAIHGAVNQLSSSESAQPIVYALPRGTAGGSTCSASIRLSVRYSSGEKISQPENPELAIGAVTASGQVL
jgi:predicted phosphoribosyltransferase